MLNVAELWAQPFPIPPHTVMALGALVLGCVQLLRPKGTGSHRLIGYIWVVLMLGTAISAVFIHTIEMWGPFSPIHILVPVTIFGVWRGVQTARQGKIKRHKFIMIQLVFLALLVTGLFTLLPGRVMHTVLFGGA